MPNYLITLKEALLAPDNAAALHQVRQHADVIRNALKEEDLELSEAELERLRAFPAWAGAVYAALADDDESEDKAEIESAIEFILHDASVEISDGFLALIELLQARRYNWRARFSVLPPVPRDIYAYLADDPTVVETRPISEPLLAHGITPSMIFACCRGLQLLFDRLGRRRSVDAPPSAECSQTGSTTFAVSVDYSDGVAPVNVPRELLYAQIRATPDLPEAGVEALLLWISDVLAVQPFLIPGYRCDERLTFVATPEIGSNDSLVALWGTDNGTRVAAKPASCGTTRLRGSAG